jgi:alkanesulfonate monooxygenase SsuD/methylene tetrahydromethanopterin reductase-like flavin-dependent oxidoreductase (luciferase family)
MRLGLLLTAGSPSREVALAQRAEAAGMHAVYTVDFQASNALVRLAAIAQATQRIRIGTGIANTFTRSPMVLGTAALDLDELSGGRLVLGLGTGLERMNREWYAVPFGKPVTRARELFGDESRWRELGEKRPIKRFGTVEEVANMIVFLCSDRCSYVSGTVITVDGGTSAA